jgi:phospholipase/carboxylesterase
VGLSGYLPLANTTIAERTDANALTPVFLAHGQQDNVVPVQAGRASRDLLKGLGYPLEWHEYPMAHSVHPQEIVDLNGWLVGVLAKA